LSYAAARKYRATNSKALCCRKLHNAEAVSHDNTEAVYDRESDRYSQDNDHAEAVGIAHVLHRQMSGELILYYACLLPYFYDRPNKGTDTSSRIERRRGMSRVSSDRVNGILYGQRCLQVSSDNYDYQSSHCYDDKTADESVGEPGSYVARVRKQTGIYL
jgi:hypothetical protein